MTYQLPPDPKLLTPEYWGGFDIGNPNHFIGAGDTNAQATNAEFRTAAEHLGRCLSQVLSGDATEGAITKADEFDPDQSERPDGFVIVITRETLSASTVYGKASEPTDREIPSTSAPLSKPYINLWKAKQLESDSQSDSFATEEFRIPNQDTTFHYARSLEWGVLFTRTRRGLDTPVRCVATWPLSSPTTSGGEVFVPVGSKKDSRPVDVLPLEFGVPSPILASPLPGGDIRAVQRITDVRLVHAAAGTKEMTPARQRLGALARHGFGRRAVPAPGM